MKRFRSRREFLFQSGGGISGLALASLLSQDGLLAAAEACSKAPSAANPFAPHKPHFQPRAKSVISLFMSGGVSHIDTFDPKPALARYAGQPLTGKGDIVVRQGNPGPLMPTPFTFRKYGQSGIDVSEIFPHIASHVDELAVIRSMYSMSNDHVQAVYGLQSGVIRMGFPCLGSWVTYGLGSENQNLPGFVVIYDARGGPLGGPSDWSQGFMPAAYQGTVFKASGTPIIDLKPPASVAPEQERARLDLLTKLNAMDAQKYPGDTELAARISSYELAYRMQSCAPESVNVENESAATRKLSGFDDPVIAGADGLSAVNFRAAMQILIAPGLRWRPMPRCEIGMHPNSPWQITSVESSRWTTLPPCSPTHRSVHDFHVTVLHLPGIYGELIPRIVKTWPPMPICAPSRG